MDSGALGTQYFVVFSSAQAAPAAGSRVSIFKFETKFLTAKQWMAAVTKGVIASCSQVTGKFMTYCDAPSLRRLSLLRRSRTSGKIKESLLNVIMYIIRG